MKKAIAVLSRGHKNNEDYSGLILRNKFIEENIKDNYDILIFNEGDITKEQQRYIQSKTVLDLKFVSITPFEPIPGVIFDSDTVIFGWGYRHMCNFWFIDFLNYVKEYDLMLRIDDDCIIRSNIDDIFKELEDYVCVYGDWRDDYENVTKHLNSFSVETIGGTIKQRDPSGPYTNVVGFNLIKLRDSVSFLKFLNTLKKSNNIFIYRWGDLPLWGEVLSYIFTQKEHKKMLIKYYHGSHIDFVNY